MHSLNVHKRPSNTWILVWTSKWKYYVELLSLIKNYLCCPLTSLSKIIKEAIKFTNFSLRGSSSVSKISCIILQPFLYDDISLEKQLIILTLVISKLFFQAIYFLKFWPIFVGRKLKSIFDHWIKFYLAFNAQPKIKYWIDSNVYCTTLVLYIGTN